MPEQNPLTQNLYASALFKDVGPEEVARIITAGQWRTVEQGQYVYRQGETDCHFYIVVQGEAELTINVAGNDQFLVSHIGPGGHFGETALLTGSSNSLNVRALTRLSLLCFDAATFNSVLLANQAIQRQLSMALARRLRVSFHDHANALARAKSKRRTQEHNLDPTFLSGPAPQPETADFSAEAGRENQPPESTIARQIRAAAIPGPPRYCLGRGN